MPIRVGGRSDSVRAFDSRGNLLRETLRDTGDTAKMSAAFGYDNAGRQIWQATLATAVPAETPVNFASINLAADRVTDFEYDADDRLEYRYAYNTNSASPLTTHTVYDALGRVYQVTDPSGSYTRDDYATSGFPIDGLLHKRTVFDGLSDRDFTFTYDSHDRVKTQTAVGAAGDPDLTTTFTYDGLDRQLSVTEPHGTVAAPESVVTATQYDLAGRPVLSKEDSGGSLERQTGFDYDKLGRLITQTSTNKTSGGASLLSQATRYRHDSLGRTVRAVYPDSAADPNDPNCVDCVKMAYDFGGRMTGRTDQLGRTTAFAYDQRSLLRTRTTGTNLDTFDYDAFGRMRLADRGITGSSTATSHATYGYNDLGDLTGESLQIAGGTARITSYGYDQAGNRTSLTYPGSVAVGYTPTAINQVAAMTLKTTPGGSEVDLVEYAYNGRMLDSRLTKTLAAGTNNEYEYRPGYDSHRQITSVGNTFALNGAPAQTVAGYTFTRDRAGNPRSQTATGLPEFAGDNRALTPDRLDRLLSTSFARGSTETATLDLQGNRESHTGRDGTTTDYALKYGTSPATTANEYATVDPDGSRSGGFSYYLHNDLYTVAGLGDDAGSIVEAYDYEAYGRPTTVGGSVTCTRGDVNGDGSVDGDDIPLFLAVLFGDDPDPVHICASDINGDGDVDDADWALLDNCLWWGTCEHVCVGGDLDGNGTVEFADLPQFIGVLLEGPASAQEACASDLTGPGGVRDGVADGVDIQAFIDCLLGADCPPPPGGTIPGSGGSGGPPSGTFFLHGAIVDQLDPDVSGKPRLVLQYSRARYYDLKNARWLQRDPTGYRDGANLYESFGGNPTVNTDPSGHGVLTLLYAGTYDASDYDFVANGGLFTAAYGLAEGAATTVGHDAVTVYQRGRRSRMDAAKAAN